MKSFLVIDLETLLPLGIYKSQLVNLAALICSKPVVHIECPDDFSMDLYDIVKDGEVLKLNKK